MESPQEINWVIGGRKTVAECINNSSQLFLQPRVWF